MENSCEITIDGGGFQARKGEVLLDAALKSGIDLAYDCRSGHCGTCRLKLVCGDVQGGKGAEPGIVHACQSRLIGNAVFEKAQAPTVRTIRGVVEVVRPATSEVLEIGIRTERTLPHLPGQYAKVRFAGYPYRPYSLTYPVFSRPAGNSIWFHIRRVQDGCVTSALGERISRGHPVELTGPYGSAHFRSGHAGRIVLVGSNTGFAPIWSIALAALRENPRRVIMIIAGGRSLEAFYMAPALKRLLAFPSVHIALACSSMTAQLGTIHRGRPTDCLPKLVTSDVIYVCGAPGLVQAVQSIAARSGAVCHADAFVPTVHHRTKARKGPSVLTRMASVFGRPRSNGRPLERLSAGKRSWTAPGRSTERQWGFVSDH